MTHLDKDTLLDHALGLVEPARRAEVAAHLDGCPVCATEARALLVEQDALRAGLAPGVEATSSRAVERRVSESARSARASSGQVATLRRRPARQLLVAAAVGLAAAGIALLVGREEQKKKQDLRCRAVLVQRVQASERAALEPSGAK